MEDINYSEVGKRLKLIRKRERLNQRDFGDEIKLSGANVANIEVGRIKLTERNASVICDQYSINEEWLWYGTGKMEKTLSVEEEIASWMGFAMNKKNDGKAIQKWAHRLSKLSVEDWEKIEELAKKLFSDENK